MSKLKFLKTLESIVEERLASGTEASYTARLAAKGPVKVAQKVGEEGVELALASLAEDEKQVIDEAADLIFHVVLLLNLRGIKLRDVVAELERRHADATR